MISENLFYTYVDAVYAMRYLQSLMRPGAPMSLRVAVKKAEEEVDSLTALHRLPPVPELHVVDHDAPTVLAMPSPLDQLPKLPGQEGN